jgi:dihydroorotate dehydrogenase (fumarate)
LVWSGPHFDQAATILNRHAGRIAYVVTMNTIGNCLTVDTETESATIAPKGGFGGLAGGFAKPIALANVAQLRKRLTDDIDIVGVGGVASGDDAFQLILCGAKAVQVATTHWLEGPDCFDRISRELSEIMARKGYTSLDQFRGKLKPYDKNNKPKEPKEESPGGGVRLPTRVFVSVPIVMLVSILIALLLFGRK